MVFVEKDGKYVPLGAIEDVIVTITDAEPSLLNTEPIVLQGTIEGDIRKIIPKGYRNAENLRRDGFLNMSNAELE